MVTPKQVEDRIDKVYDAILSHIETTNNLTTQAVYKVKDEVFNLKSDINRNLTGANLTISDLRNYIDILLQFIAEKYDKGTIIIYDEHNPRGLKLIKDGNIVDTTKAQSITFYYSSGEFPTITIDE